MRKLQIVIYLFIILCAYCEQEQIPVSAYLWHSTANFWYGLAEFAGRRGIAAEANYHEEMSYG
jgi:hypothetical protein